MSRANYVGRGKLPNITGLIFGFFLFGVAAFLGMMAAYLPFGFMLKLSVLGIGGLFLLAISIRPKSAYKGREGNIGFLLLMALVVSVIVWPGYFFLHVGSSPNINLPVLLKLAILMVSIGFILRRREIREACIEGIAKTGWLLGLLISWHLWLILAATFGNAPIPSIVHTLKILFFSVGTYLGLLCFLNSREKVNYLIVAILVAGLFSILFGLVEFSIKKNPLSNFISASDADQSLALLRNLSERYRNGAYRIQSTFTHPISAGQFFSMLFFLGIFAFFNTSDKLLKYISGAVVPLSVIMIHLTGSRSAYVAVAAGLLMLLPIVLLNLFRAGQYSLRYFTIAIFGLVIAFLALILAVNMLPGLFDQLLASDKGSSSARLEMLSRGISAISESPVVGYGPHMSAIKAGMTGSDGYLTIDNYLLTISIDYGLPAFIIYISIFLMAIFYAFKKPMQYDELGPNMVLLAPVIICYVLIQTIASIDANETIAIVFCFILIRSVSLGQSSSFSSPPVKVSVRSHG